MFRREYSYLGHFRVIGNNKQTLQYMYQNQQLPTIVKPIMTSQESFRLIPELIVREVPALTVPFDNVPSDGVAVEVELNADGAGGALGSAEGAAGATGGGAISRVQKKYKTDASLWNIINR